MRMPPPKKKPDPNVRQLSPLFTDLVGDEDNQRYLYADEIGSFKLSRIDPTSPNRTRRVKVPRPDFRINGSDDYFEIGPETTEDDLEEQFGLGEYYIEAFGPDHRLLPGGRNLHLGGVLKRGGLPVKPEPEVEDPDDDDDDDDDEEASALRAELAELKASMRLLAERAAAPPAAAPPAADQTVLLGMLREVMDRSQRNPLDAVTMGTQLADTIAAASRPAESDRRAEIEELRRTHRQELERHDKDIDALRTEKIHELGDIRRKAENELAEARRKLERELEEVRASARAERERLDKDLSELRSSHRAETDALRAHHAAETDRRARDLDSQRSESRGEIERRARELETQRSEMQKELHELRTRRENELSALRMAHEAATTELRIRLESDAAARLKEADAKLRALTKEADDRQRALTNDVETARAETWKLLRKTAEMEGRGGDDHDDGKGASMPDPGANAPWWAVYLAPAVSTIAETFKGMAAAQPPPQFAPPFAPQQFPPPQVAPPPPPAPPAPAAASPPPPAPATPAAAPRPAPLHAVPPAAPAAPAVPQFTTLLMVSAERFEPPVEDDADAETSDLPVNSAGSIPALAS
jgi:hypothetical protein